MTLGFLLRRGVSLNASLQQIHSLSSCRLLHAKPSSLQCYDNFVFVQTPSCCLRGTNRSVCLVPNRQFSQSKPVNQHEEKNPLETTKTSPSETTKTPSPKGSKEALGVVADFAGQAFVTTKRLGLNGLRHGVKWTQVGIVKLQGIMRDEEKMEKI